MSLLHSYHNTWNAFTCCMQYTHWQDDALPYAFYSFLFCHKIQRSDTHLHLVVNLRDCLCHNDGLLHNRRQEVGIVPTVYTKSWASETTKPSQCLFVSLWRTILPSYIRENWTERSHLTGLWAWYGMCDQLKDTAVLLPICLKQLCIIYFCRVWMWCDILSMNQQAPHLFSSAEMLSDLSSSISCPHACLLGMLTLDD